MTLKLQVAWLLLPLLICFSCNRPAQPAAQSGPATKPEETATGIAAAPDRVFGWPVKLHTLTGDFNGDGKPDTLRQGLYSKALQRPITFIVAEENGVDQGWICSLAPLSYLTATGLDSLVFFPEECAQTGLSYLLNLGDLNMDGTDEIGVVIEWADFSSINSCKIFSYCNGKWEWQQSFTIREEEADPEEWAAQGPHIPEFLERRNGRWHFKDYWKAIEADTTEGGYDAMYLLTALAWKQK